MKKEEIFNLLFNEPESEEVGKFLRMAGISDRNWRIFLRRYGRDEWTFAQIAEEFHIARPRAFQIVKRTEELFAKGCEALRLGNAGKILNRMRRM